MKKKLKIFLASALAGVTVCSLTACGLFAWGIYGQTDYKTPYEIAQEQGETQTEAEWLSALYGSSQASVIRAAFDEAQAEGYEGTFLEFLKEFLTVSSDDTAGVARASLSAVSVTCDFVVKTSSFLGSGYQTKGVTSYGSGVIYSIDKEAGNAYVITNYHVVYHPQSIGDERVAHVSDEIYINLFGSATSGTEIPATYVGGVLDCDLAVLKITNNEVIKNSDARAAVFANSDHLLVGQKTYAIGNPDNEGFSVVSGVVSVDAEYTYVQAADHTDAVPNSINLLELRTDAPVNHGNSGGGLYNADGMLIGIVNARSEEDGIEAFGYAIPSNLVLAVVENVMDNADVLGALRATLGVTASRVEQHAVFDETTQKLMMSESILVTATTNGSPAASALRVNDVLVSAQIEGEEKLTFTRYHQLGTFMYTVREGDTVTFEYYRGDTLSSFSVTFAASNFDLFD